MNSKAIMIPGKRPQIEISKIMVATLCDSAAGTKSDFGHGRPNERASRAISRLAIFLSQLDTLTRKLFQCCEQICPKPWCTSYPAEQERIRCISPPIAAASQPRLICAGRFAARLASSGRDINPNFSRTRRTRSDIFLRYSSGA